MYLHNKQARLLTGGLVGVPPGYGDAHWDDVTLLLDGSSLTDDLSTAGHDVSNAGGVSILSTTGPYGTTQDVLDFNWTNTGHLVGTAGDLTDLGDGSAWTMECWVKLDGTSAQQGVFGVSAGSPPPNNRGITLRWGGTNGNWEWWTVGYGQPGSLVSSASTATTNWQHVAIVHTGTSSTLYVDGVAKGTSSYGTVLNSTDKVVLGRNYADYDEGRLNGYIADFRITKGVARYTAAFTPPTKSLPINAPVVGRRGVGSVPTTGSNGGMLTLYDRYIDTLV